MKARLFLVTITCAALMACSSSVVKRDIPERGVTQGYNCKDNNLDRFVGGKASQQSGQEALAASGAKTLEWIPPDVIVTMAYNWSRLRVYYDEQRVITKLTCG